MIAITVAPARRDDVVHFCVVDEDGDPSFWPVRLFEVIDARLPSSWAAHLDDAGRLELAPGAWIREGFWEELEGNAWSTSMAGTEFRRDVAAMRAELG